MEVTDLDLFDVFLVLNVKRVYVGEIMHSSSVIWNFFLEFVTLLSSYKMLF